MVQTIDDMEEFRKGSKERADENIMQVSDLMEKLESKFQQTKCFEEVPEKLACQSTPLDMMAAVQAHQILRTWLLQNKTSLSKNERKVGHHIGDAVMLLCCAECSKLMDRKEFLQVADAAYNGNQGSKKGIFKNHLSPTWCLRTLWKKHHCAPLCS